MAATRSLDPVLAKIRLMCVFTVWLLRNSRAAISGLVSPWAMSARISASRCVSPSGARQAGGFRWAGAGAAGAAAVAAATRAACTRASSTDRPPAAARSALAMSARSASLVR